ncbi:MAG: hypothetical protein PSY14_15480 [bacterium]|nr:hypothetical protein [bacterium]
MKFASVLLAVILLSTPAYAYRGEAAANRGDETNAPKIVIAKTSATQRAVAESISGRLRSALESEPYTLDIATPTETSDISISR